MVFIKMKRTKKMALRWGVAGTGMMSHDFVTALHTLSESDHKILVVAGMFTEQTREFALQHGIKKAYQGFEFLAKDENIDIVYIGLANPLHFEIAKLMLANGKHVLCEKPMCMQHKETKELIEFARSKNLFLMEGMWSRFFPAYEALDKHISSGGLGKVFQVNIEFGVYVPDEERHYLGEYGGGTVADLGVYAVQLAQLIYKDEPMKIICGGHIDSEGIDESMSCVLLYSDGRTATLSTSTKGLLANNAVIHGTNGSIKLQTFWAPTVLQMSAADITEWQLPSAAQRFNFHNSAGLTYEAEECRKCINAGLLESPKMSHSESILVAQICDTLREQLYLLDSK